MYSYTRANRLKKADEFSSVFMFKKVRFGKWFKIYFKPNQLNYSRLGVIVSKKNNKRANKRNYMKRVIRELFRIYQIKWYALDIVVRVSVGFDRENYSEVKDEFIRLTSVFTK